MSHETASPIVALAALAALTLDQRKVHLRWLGELTQLPTASGKEWRVIRWVERWASERSDVVLSRDPSGNITLSLARMAAGSRPVYFTGHLDHPAFVVERIVSPSTLELSFRGGVMDDYFKEAKVAVYNARDEVVKGTITESLQGPAFKHYLVELASGSTMHHALGDVGVWDLPRAEVKDGNFHTLACDDLAAVAAALAAFDVLRAIAARGELRQDVRVLLTRAEEIGFIGAIAAVKHGTIPADARVMAGEQPLVRGEPDRRRADRACGRSAECFFTDADGCDRRPRRAGRGRGLDGDGGAEGQRVASLEVAEEADGGGRVRGERLLSQRARGDVRVPAAGQLPQHGGPRGGAGGDEHDEAHDRARVHRRE